MKINAKILSAMTVVALALMLFGCGTADDAVDALGPSNGGGLTSDTPTPSFDSGLEFSDLNDTSVFEIDFRVSPVYNATTGMVDIYMMPEDQNNILLNRLNKYNYGVGVTASGGVTYLDMGNPDITLTEVVGDTTRTVGLAIDSSGSMAEPIDPNDTTSPIRMQTAIDSAQLYVSTMAATDRTALIDFDTGARISEPVTSNKTVLSQAIGALVADGGTNIGAALSEVSQSVGAFPGKRAGILLSDGADTAGLIPAGIADANDAGIPVFAIRFGVPPAQGVDVASLDLQNIADSTNGKFYLAQTAAELAQVFAVDIPDAIDALPSRTGMKLTVPVPPNSFPGTTYGLEVKVRYENAFGIHQATKLAKLTVQ